MYEKSLADAEVARWVQSRAEALVRVSQRERGSRRSPAAAHREPPRAPSVPPLAPRRLVGRRVHREMVDRAPLVARLTAERRYWDASVERYKSERMPPVAFELIGGRGDLGEARIGGGVVITFPVTRRYQGEIARAEQGPRIAVDPSRPLSRHRRVEAACRT